jgi:hypothetical protein
MLVMREPDEVRLWNLVFWDDSALPLARWIPGRFKHVAAYGYAPLCLTWVVVDRNWHGLDLKVFPRTDDAMAKIQAWSRSAKSVLALPPSRPVKPSPLGFWCVPAMRALVGVPGGALFVDGFYRDCLRAGAEILFDEPTRSEARPHASGGTGAG